MLTRDSPIGYLHRNRSDVLHFFHSGSPLTYWIINPTGSIEKHVLGPTPSIGHKLQLLVPGGFWKATELKVGDYGLLSEVVTPGFEFEDMKIADAKDIEPIVSASQWRKIRRFIKRHKEL